MSLRLFHPVSTFPAVTVAGAAPPSDPVLVDVSFFTTINVFVNLFTFALFVYLLCAYKNPLGAYDR